MCPFCVGTAVWIAAGVVSTGGLSALAAKKILSGRKRDEGVSDDKQ